MKIRNQSQQNKIYLAQLILVKKWKITKSIF